MLPIIALTLGLIAHTNCLAATQQEVLKADSGEHSFLASTENPLISVPIENNRTTGFNWYLEEYNEKLIQPVASSYDTATSQDMQTSMVGAPGVTTWKFKVLKPAFRVPTVTKVVLRYARSWNQTSSITKTIWIFTSDYDSHTA